MTTRNINSKFFTGLAALLFIAAFFLLDIGHYLSLEFLKSKQQLLMAYATDNRILSVTVYFLLYVLAAAFSLPVTTLLTLAGGAIFGFTTGVFLTSFASTIGATLAFLFSRFLFKDTVQSKFSSYLKAVNSGIEKEGAFYLFTLRLVPIVPFFIANMLMGLTPIKTRTFYLVSQLGMLPSTAVFAFAGSQLAQITSVTDIVSPTLLFAFALLGLFPITAKKLLELYKYKQAPISV